MFSGLFGCIWGIAFIVLMGYPLWRIFQKLGYPGVASLIMYVPVVNVIALWYAALNPMPFEQRLYGGAAVPPYPPYSPPPPPPPPIQP
jgi:hypothetical protein